MNLRSKKRCGESGLTLVEMMVATTLLLVMMLGLTSMFNQTQRAFRSGLKQVDIFEGGRAVMDLITRDIEQAAATGVADNMNMYVTIPPGSTSLDQDLVPNGSRQNVLYEMFFFNHASQWNALGYRVLNPDALNANGLIYGSLYRFSTNFSEFGAVTNEHLGTFFQNASKITNSIARVADGIVHFRIRCYGTNGVLIPRPNEFGNVIYNGPNGLATNNVPDGVRVDNFTPSLPNEPRIQFDSTIPAMIEIELGMLEPQTLEQARAMTDPAAFLKKQAGKVHIFRQQITIRNAPR